jgi:hypothetical protein
MNEQLYTVWHWNGERWEPLVTGLTKDRADKLVKQLANRENKVRVLPEGDTPK